MKLAFVGQPVGGKDTAAEYVSKKYGLVHISSGDLVRNYITQNNLGGLERENVQKYAIFLRDKFGGDHLVKVAIEKNPDNLIISGLRAIDEVETFKKLGGTVIAVTAPIERRFEWAKKPGRVGDHVTFEDFKAIEEKESSSTNRNAQNVGKMIEMADIEIKNDQGLEDLLARCDEIVASLKN